jgi:membrane-associated phospholipid phosphatase
VTIILATLTVIVCVGRVLALVHTPLDVIGGVLVAFVGALWYLQANQKHVQQPLAKTAKS